MPSSNSATRETDGPLPVGGGHFGDSRRLIGPFRTDHLKFGIIGLYNTGFSFAVFAGFTLAFPSVVYIAALLVSHVLGTLNAYVAYRMFVFRVHGHWLRDLARFWLVYAGGLTVNLLALPLLVEIVRLPVLLGQLCVVVVGAIGSWFGHRYISFRRRPLGPHVEAVVIRP